MSRAPIAAVVLAAGQGTRMKSAVPKVLHPVGGLPLAAHPIRLALGLDAAPVVVVVGHQAERVERTLGAAFPGRVRFALQAEQLGTGHAVQCALPALEGFDGVVVILAGDVPLLRRATVERLLAALDGDAERRPVVAAATMILDDPTGYGRIVRDAAGRLTGIVEHKDATPEQRAIRETNAGIYAVDAAFLRAALARLRNDNAQREYYLTDVVAFAAADPRGAAAVVVDDPWEVAGANDRAQLADLDRALRRRTNRAHMLAGVTMIDPDSTYVGLDVELAPDVTLGPGVHLRGKTRVARGATIDAGAILTDVEVGEDVEIRAYSVLDDARVERAAIIGPFSRLRPGAEIGPEAHVGNFVEIKKATLGPGAKANHLAYVGDARVGARANVGAGTITCNYDGYGKYLTDIGDDVFVGSNSTLVAPVKLGDRAYVAAGSTITDPVEADALALGRARQVDKPGRAPALRAAAKERAAAHKSKKA
jgi:bifunctional UDP-N-acetylglucosamine pyrophosphorylase/glucosamine-1-phosphate N-acetyltransferase